MPATLHVELVLTCRRTRMKKIGFLSFGHWNPFAAIADALGLGCAAAIDRTGGRRRGAGRRRRLFPGASLRPPARLAVPAAGGGRGAHQDASRSAPRVIDMRYENPLYMAEDAGAADLIAGGRLQLGISRGSPEQVIDGWRHFGYEPAEGETDADMARRHAEVLLDVLRGEGFAAAQSAADVSQPAGPAAPRAAFGGPARAHLVGRRLPTPRRYGRPSWG